MTASRFVFIAHPGPDPAVGRADTVQEEARLAFAAVDARLRELGLDLSHVVKMRLWYTELQDFPDMNSVREPLYRATFANESWPASSGFVTGGRGGATPRFELEAIAHPLQHGRSTDAAIRQWGDVRPPYAHANSAGEVVFLSGQGGYTQRGELVAPDPRAQARGAVAALRRVLGAEGLSVAEVVGMTVFTAPRATAARGDVEAEIGEMLAGVPADALPVTTYVEARELAFPGMLVEIEVVAVRATAAGVVKRSRSTGVTGASSSHAVLAGPLLVASAGATTVDAAWADLVERCGDLEVVPDGPGLVTVWFAPPSTRDAVEAAARLALPAGLTVSVQPAAAEQDAPRVTLELVAAPETTHA